MRPIPSPKSLPVLGTMASIIAAGGAPKLHLYVDRRHKELGPIYREKIGPVSGVFVAEANYMRKIFAAEGKYPKHIVPEAWLYYNKIYDCKRGLLFMDNEEWLTFRKIMNNILLKVKQDEFFKAANITADDLVAKWKKESKVTDLEKQLYKWSLEVIVTILLGSDSYKQCKSDFSVSIEQLAKTVHQIFIESATLSLVPVKMAVKLKFPVWKRFVLAATSAMEEGRKLVEKILEREKRNPNSKSLISEMLKTEMNVTDVKRIVIDLILAAGDTTAHTTQWLLHLLSLDAEIQAAIYNQLHDLKEEEVLRSPLLKGAVKEALRLYPVAPFITRFMPEDVIVDDFHIKSQELVLMSLYTSGRMEKYFPKPDSFIPQRWIRDSKGYEGVTNPNASLPFAMGARSCIGKKIAETQILVTVSKILKNFVLKTENTKKIDITLHLISVPAEPITLSLESRKT